MHIPKTASENPISFSQ